ncbi:MAG TPA: ACP S-malonyltransferase [Anaeromyxobacteraceae bacterium]|nr:ACP S-malonyltransferase [Anaeromyxobacteraceae bacterium]
MHKLAFIFPGQGSQAAGMGKALHDAFPEARAVFEEVDQALGEKLSALCFEGPEEKLKLTANTQPAILAVSAAAAAVLASRGIRPGIVAGHSLGEYSALVAAGSLSAADAARAVRARGTFMQEAVPAGRGAMAAVVGLEPERIRVVCESVAVASGKVVAPANYNDPNQTVIAGEASAMALAGEKLKEAGARRVMALPVSAPFHCALMEPVKARLEPVLRAVRWAQPSVPVVTNVEAKANRAVDRIVPLLLAQVSAPVRWIETVHELARLGATRMVEVGPGNVLSGLVKRIDKAIEVHHVGDVDSLERTLKAMGA